MALCSVVTVLVAREHQHTLKEGEEVKTVLGTFVDIYKGFRYMPLPLFLIGMLFFLSWFAYTPLMTNQSTYFVNNMYGTNSTAPHHSPVPVPSIGPSAAPVAPLGAPTSTPTVFRDIADFIVNSGAADTPIVSPGPGLIPVYAPASDPAYINNRRGTQVGFYSLAIFAAVQFLYSLVAPKIVDGIGLKWAYFIPQLVATAAYISTPFLSYPYKRVPVPVVVTVFCLVAPNFVAFNSVPFALVSGLTSGASGGLYMGVLNAAGVVAQTTTNLIVSAILKVAKPLPLNTPIPTQNVGYGIAFGGIASALACIWCLVFIRDNMVKKNLDGEVDEKKPLIQNQDPETEIHTVQ